LNYTQTFSSDPDYLFYVNSVLQQLNLRSQISIAMKKVSGENITAGLLSQNFKETVKEFIANDKAFSFMSSIKGTPAYYHLIITIKLVIYLADIFSHVLFCKIKYSVTK
jgi:hypothetical protein